MTTHDLTPTTTNGTGELVLTHPRPADQTPALVYLAGLAGGDSRRTMRQALDTIAGLVSGGALDALTLDWAALRFQHTAAIRARLAECIRRNPAGWARADHGRDCGDHGGLRKRPHGGRRT